MIHQMPCNYPQSCWSSLHVLCADDKSTCRQHFKEQVVLTIITMHSATGDISIQTISAIGEPNSYLTGHTNLHQWLNSLSGIAHLAQNIYYIEIKAQMPAVVYYRKSVFRVCISETLDVIEDEPGNRDDHENDKWDSNKKNRRPVHAVQGIRLHSAERNLHEDSCSIVYYCGQSFTILTVDENGNDIWYYKTWTKKT